MEISIIIPHYKTGNLTAYTVYQFLKFKGNHKVKLIVGDNNAGDGSLRYLEPFKNEISIVNYPKDKMQSHGILIDYILSEGYVNTEYFFTTETDAFPTKEGYLDYYEKIINEEYDLAASLLQLSGGLYGHPAGAIYKKSLWDEAKKYCEEMPYAYFPNMQEKEGFDCHLMVHNSILDEFIKNPDNYVELAKSYKPYTPLKATERLIQYSPTCQPFHDGRGGNIESIKTFGGRTSSTDSPTAMYNESWKKLIPRIGYEPGEFIYFYAVANNKKIFHIPTEVKWMKGKENQQQEYTLNEAGIKHHWALTAYYDYTPENEKEVAKFKQSIPEQLYSTLPSNFKI